MARGRLICTGLAAAILCLAAALGPDPAQARVRGNNGTHVYLFRGGFAGMFSQGMDSIAAQLNGRGIRASVYPHGSTSSAANSAIAEYRSNGLRNIIIMGHSLGGPAAVEMAAELAQARVPVSLIVTFDPVGSPAVPSNVRRVVNLYVSGGIGVKLEPSQKFRGSLQNLNQSSEGHVSIVYSHQLQRRAVALVLGTMGRAR
jgi:pimeloyl-ACP methyl ester carboxylesterase